MENEIKVNEYVRMIDGLIAEIVTKDKDDHFILDRYYAGGRHLTEIEVKNDIVKHSPNLIDIIEERRLCKWRKSNRNKRMELFKKWLF